VRANHVYENYGEGIGVLSSRGVQITSNVVYDNFSVNIYLDNAPEAAVQYNVIASTGNPEFFRDGRPASSVLIANEETDHFMPSEGIWVIDNTMIGVGDVGYGSYGLNTGLSSSVLTPNWVHPSLWFVPPHRSGT
jgi:pectate lyase